MRWTLGLFGLAGCGLQGPTPTVQAVAPAVVCDADAATVHLTGAGFGVWVSNLDDDPQIVGPEVLLTRVGDPTGAADALSGRALRVPGVTWRADGDLELALGPEVGLVAGLYDVTVTDPAGASDTLPRALVVLDPPQLIDVVPGAVCVEAGDVQVTAHADGVYHGDALPTVTFAGAVVPADAVDACTPLGNGAGELCADVLATIAPGALPIGPTTLSVTHAAPAACPSNEVPITITPPPTAAAILPSEVCGDDTPLVVTGTRFDAWTSVHVGGVRADVTYVDPETLAITLGAGTPAGPQPVVVGLDQGCPTEVPGGITVITDPRTLFVDPEVVWSGMATAVTAYVEAPPNPVVDVTIVGPDGTRTALAWAVDPTRPSALQVTVPMGLPGGTYDVAVTYEGNCVGAVLEGGLVVADTLGVSVDTVEPGYAWTYDFTPVEIRAADPLPTGLVGFADLPLVYLSPEDPSQPGFALRAVTFRDAGRLTAVLPDGLALGAYDVVVINPDGGIGVKAHAVTVIADPLPRIDSVSPPSLPNNDDTTVAVLGAEFRDPTASLTCLEAGVERTFAVDVTAWSFAEVDVRVPASTLSDAICVVTITNADGAYARYSAISIRNPAENLFPWAAGTDLVEARRAPVAVAGRTNAMSRYVYAIGGDDGTAAGAKASLERAPIGAFGEMDAWEALGDELPGARTLAAGVRIGSFVYAIGGSDGSKALSSVVRARILDPVDVPHFDDVVFDSDVATGLIPGRWTYRVAATYPATDPSNPGGESLPSEPFSLRIPSGTDPLAVTLGWRPVDGASGYRVYRSAAADDPVGQEVWLADVTDATFTDDGVPADPSVSPLIDGALGVWTTVSSLTTARQSPCAVVAEDDSVDPVIWRIYVAGGLSSAGAALSSIERVDVTIVSATEQNVGAWTALSQRLSVAREQCGAYGLTSALHSTVADGDTWLVFAGGLAGKKATGAADAGKVADDGSLSSWQVIDTMSPARAGFGAAAASDFLYAIGGHGGAPSASGASAELTTVPTVRNWNNLGVSMTTARYLAGSAQESALILEIGGQTDTAAASSTTDVTSY